MDDEISTFIDFSNTAIAKDKSGTRYLAQQFKFPNGEKGMAIIMRLTKGDWEPDITDIEIHYEN